MGVAEMGWIHTGLQYQAFHTLAIFGTAVAMQRRISIWFYWSSVFMALGTVLLAAASTAGAIAFTPVGVRYAGRGRLLPRRLGINVNWCNSTET